VAKESQVNKRYCASRLRVDYPHVGLFDVRTAEMWIAKKKWGVSPVRVSHARLLVGGTQDTSTINKDQFLCYWFHTPNTGEGYVQGYPVEWEEGHLLVRMDPTWNYSTCTLIPLTDTAKIEANIERQYTWGQKIFDAYVDLKPKFPLSWHMIGPRPTDSMFYIQRVEAQG
jgi:hypothetical protein